MTTSKHKIEFRNKLKILIDEYYENIEPEKIAVFEEVKKERKKSDPITEKTRKKMSESAKKRPKVTQETKEKISATCRRKREAKKLLQEKTG